MKVTSPINVMPSFNGMRGTTGYKNSAYTNASVSAGTPIEPAKTTKYLSSTYNDALEFYKDYRESLGDISLKEIRKITDNITETTDFTREEVLTAMQQLTQFANMRSFKMIPDTLKKYQVFSIGDSGCASYVNYARATNESSVRGRAAKEAVNDDKGLHNALIYLIDKKEFGNLAKYQDNSKTGVILDDKKLTQYERFKEENPENFKKYVNSPQFKFFLISGWDNGITFADRSKGLETETIKLLEFAKENDIPINKAIDYSMMKRIKALGITPIVIKTEGVPTEMCIYKQTTPEKMSQNEFLNLLDSNSQIRSNGDKVKEFECKDQSIKYLRDNLKVYTPETLTKSIQNMHEKIIDFAAEKGFAPKDILYVEPIEKKSYCLIDYLYQKVNNIPYRQFIEMSDLVEAKPDLRHKLLVFLDDCTISGESIEEILTVLDSYGKKSAAVEDAPKLFACICGTPNVEDMFDGGKEGEYLIIQDYLDYERIKRGHLVNEDLEKSIGYALFKGGYATCLSFPYMSPDNNTEIGANIALLHNSMYRARNIDGKGNIINPGIKNYTNTVNDITLQYQRMIGMSPSHTDKSIEEIKSSGYAEVE